MKKNILRFSAPKLLLATLSLLAFVPLDTKGFADTQVDDTTSTANAFINVTAPSSGGLTLTQSPDFDFGTTPISVAQKTLNGTADADYQVTNITGTNVDFDVQQTVSDFTQTVQGATVKLPITAYYITVVGNDDGSLVGSTGINVYGQAGTILTSGSENTGVLTSGTATAQMSVAGGGQIRSGTYNATVMTSLVTGV